MDRKITGQKNEEAGESGNWLELIGDGGLLKSKRIEPLMREPDELTRIFAATIRTTKRNRKKSAKPNS